MAAGYKEAVQIGQAGNLRSVLPGEHNDEILAENERIVWAAA